MKAKKPLFVLVLLALVFSNTSCFGPFNASSRLNTWEREFENRWAGEGVFFVLWAVKVNTLLFLGDALIFNSIEFWGGTNPIDPPSKERLQALRDADDARAREMGHEVPESSGE